MVINFTCPLLFVVDRLIFFFAPFHTHLFFLSYGCAELALHSNKEACNALVSTYLEECDVDE
jgi:hypothetical protein